MADQIGNGLVSFSGWIVLVNESDHFGTILAIMAVAIILIGIFVLNAVLGLVFPGARDRLRNRELEPSSHVGHGNTSPPDECVCESLIR